MNGFLDFIPVMINWIEKNKPERIFEYGVGTGTICICKLFPEVKYVSIEPSIKWYLIHKVSAFLNGCKNLEIRYVPGKERFRNYLKDRETAYTYDLIFLDSPTSYSERLAILNKLIKFNVPIMCHDACKYLETEKRNVVVNQGD